MHALCNRLILVGICWLSGLCWEGSLSGQEKELEGFLRFVNATGCEGKLFVEVDKINVNPEGYESGYATGTVGLFPKTLQIEMKHEVLGEFKLPVEIKVGEVVSVVALLKKEEEVKKAGEAKKEPKLELTCHVQTAPYYKKGEPSTLTLLQCTPAERLEIKVGNQVVGCERMKEAKVVGGLADAVPVELAGKNVAQMNFFDPTDAVLVMFVDRKGVLKWARYDNKVR